MELQLPQINSLGAFFEGRTAGREVKRQKTLADYMPGAMTGDKDAISRIAGVDPDAAMKAQTHAGQLKGEAAQQLVQQAKWFTQAPESMKPQLYASLVKTAHAAGMDYIPETYDPQFAKGIEQLAGVGGQADPRIVAPGSALVGNDGKVIYERPFAPKGFDGVWDGERAMWIPRPGAQGQPQQATMPAPTTGGGGQVLGNAYEGAKLDPVADFPAFASQFGAQITSTERDPRHNAKVGGVANSFHLTGEAGDFVVPAAQRPSFIAAAKAKGYQAIDEGDHVHLEPPGRGMTASRFGGQQGGIAGIPVAGVAPRSKGQKPTDLERRIEMARKMGASEDEIKRLVLGQSAPSTRDALGGKPLTQGTVNQLAKDAGRLTNLQNLAGGFVDDFAGNKITGAAENYLGRLGLPLATKGQAEWWQQYDRMKNEVRNELFGASLTAGEKAAFEAADIAPNMSPDVIRKNLAAQQRIIQQGLERKAKTWAAQGYNRDAIREVSGVDVSPQQKQASGGKYAVGQIIQQGGKRYRVTDVSDPNDPDVEEVR